MDPAWASSWAQGGVEGGQCFGALDRGVKCPDRLSLNVERCWVCHAPRAQSCTMPFSASHHSCCL